MLAQTLDTMLQPHAPNMPRNNRCPTKEPAMNISFGTYSRPSSFKWDDIRKGPTLETVREHIDRVVNFTRYSGIARKR
jgi:hypothetical protein